MSAMLHVWLCLQASSEDIQWPHLETNPSCVPIFKLFLFKGRETIWSFDICNVWMCKLYPQHRGSIEVIWLSYNIFISKPSIHNAWPYFSFFSFFLFCHLSFGLFCEMYFFLPHLQLPVKHLLWVVTGKYYLVSKYRGGNQSNAEVSQGLLILMLSLATNVCMEHVMESHVHTEQFKSDILKTWDT